MTWTPPHTFVDGPGNTASGEQVMDNLNDLASYVAGGGGTVRRGKSIIATTESRTDAAYGTLTTPDHVTGLVLPSDGLICVLYRATWQESVAGAARAAIFLGVNQLKSVNFGGGPPAVAWEATTDSGGHFAEDYPLSSWPTGLAGASPGNAYTGDVTTGQLVSAYGREALIAGSASGQHAAVGGPCYIFAAAGTYDVSVQFKASSGSVTAKNRKLWVWTEEF